MTLRTKRPGRLPRATLPAAVALMCVVALQAHAVRIKDITEVEGIRGNPLYGFGLVVGLGGTGGGSDFTSEVVENMMEKLRVGRGLEELDTANIAAVIVTAELPPFARKGSTLDVTVSALDETASLRGGTLILTPLTGADGAVYAVAQGAVSVAGFSFGGAAASVQQGHPTVGRIPSGATVEREVQTHFVKNGAITLTLHSPDFATATRIAAAIESQTRDRAVALDAGTVRVLMPRELSSTLTTALIPM